MLTISLALDKTSLLAQIEGDAPLVKVEEKLRAEGLTLDLDAPFDGTLAEWIAAGAPGARDAWLDPADQLVAGFEARLDQERVLTVRPAPRRAVGPDLLALVMGCHGRFATLLRAWVRVHPLGARRPSAPPFVRARDPELTDAEAKLLDAIERALVKA